MVFGAQNSKEFYQQQQNDPYIWWLRCVWASENNNTEQWSVSRCKCIQLDLPKYVDEIANNARFYDEAWRSCVDRCAQLAKENRFLSLSLSSFKSLM